MKKGLFFAFALSMGMMVGCGDSSSDSVTNASENGGKKSSDNSGGTVDAQTVADPGRDQSDQQDNDPERKRGRFQREVRPYQSLEEIDQGPSQQNADQSPDPEILPDEQEDQDSLNDVADGRDGPITHSGHSVQSVHKDADRIRSQTATVETADPEGRDHRPQYGDEQTYRQGSDVQILQISHCGYLPDQADCRRSRSP